MTMDAISVLATFLGWIPSAARWVLEFWPMKGAPHIAFKTRLQSQPNATLKLKLYVDISNERTASVVVSSAFFVADPKGPIRLDPAWKIDQAKGRYYCPFINAKGDFHDRLDAFLRSREQTNTYVAIDPTHQTTDVEQAVNRRAIGTLYLYLTWWNEVHVPNSRLLGVRI